MARHDARPLSLALLSGFILTLGASAATALQVNSTADTTIGSCDTTCTLRDAVNLARKGEVIDFSVTGTITLTQGPLTVSKDLTLIGPGAGDLTIDGNENRILIVEKGLVSLSGLTLANGKSVGGHTSNHTPGGFNGQGGAIYAKNGVVHVADMIFADNQAIGGNGGAAVSDRAGGGGGNGGVGATLSNTGAAGAFGGGGAGGGMRGGKGGNGGFGAGGGGGGGGGSALPGGQAGLAAGDGGTSGTSNGYGGGGGGAGMGGAIFVAPEAALVLGAAQFIDNAAQGGNGGNGYAGGGGGGGGAGLGSALFNHGYLCWTDPDVTFSGGATLGGSGGLSASGYGTGNPGSAGSGAETSEGMYDHGEEGCPTVLAANPLAAPYSTVDTEVVLTARFFSFVEVTGGRIQFSVRNADNVQIGNSVDANLAGNIAAATWTLPTNTPAGNYTLQVTFTPLSGDILLPTASEATLRIVPAAALMTSTPVAPGSDCPAGGLLIHAGVDDGRSGGIAGDGVLQSGEVTSSQFICNGQNGEDGQDGADGSDGADGADGQDGVDGRDGANALVDVETIEPGETCAAGGILVHTGIDDGRNGGVAGNGSLDEGEITSSRIICHGVDGKDGADGQNGSDGADGADGQDGANALVNVETIEPGETCAAGGVLIHSGIDDGRNEGIAGNDSLEQGEITSSQILCHGAAGQDGSDGADGANGVNALVSTEIVEPGEICAAGGVLIHTGIDDGRNDGIAGNDILEEGEITSSQVLCHGVDGRDGVDGIDGEDGVDGKDGASALVKAEAFGPGEECETGGLLIISGVDDGRLDGIANDGILQPGEITGSYVVCNGVDGQHGEDGSSGIDGRDGTDGASALVHTESIEPGDICLAGGIRIDAGTDDGSGEDGIAHDGTLQPGELLSSHVVCNGAPDTSEFEGGCGGCASPPLTSLTLLGLAMLRRRGR